MPYKIVDDRLVLAPYPLWMMSYDTSNGLVTAMTKNENLAKPFTVEQDANDACYLINNNANNSFIGHVPPPPHH